MNKKDGKFTEAQIARLGYNKILTFPAVLDTLTSFYMLNPILNFRFLDERLRALQAAGMTLNVGLLQTEAGTTWLSARHRVSATAHASTTCTTSSACTPALTQSSRASLSSTRRRSTRRVSVSGAPGPSRTRRAVVPWGAREGDTFPYMVAVPESPVYATSSNLVIFDGVY